MSRSWEDWILGTFDSHGDIDIDDVTPLSLAMLGMCIDATWRAPTTLDRKSASGAANLARGVVLLSVPLHDRQ